MIQSNLEAMIATMQRINERTEARIQEMVREIEETELILAVANDTCVRVSRETY
jgi:predicted secreted Zn-dependent protease